MRYGQTNALWNVGAQLLTQKVMSALVLYDFTQQDDALLPSLLHVPVALIEELPHLGVELCLSFDFFPSNLPVDTKFFSMFHLMTSPNRLSTSNFSN